MFLFLLRRSHNEQVAKILSDPEASDNDKYVALTFLRNAEVSAKGKLPLCQDTGTAIIHGEKGQQVWTGYCDEEALSLGVYKTYTEENLRYSQNAPLTMYDEVNTKCNLPAQIDLEATEGMEYKFLCVTKGGGSANKTYLYQETKAVLNPATLVPFLVEKMKTLGTAACPPYHIAFVIGGTSAEKNLLTVKLASTHYYDELPTTGNEYGRAFRDVELEKQVLEEAYKIGLGAQFGGKYMAHDVRIIRLPQYRILINIFYRSIVCYSRSHRQNFTLFFRIKLNILPYLRTRSYQTHIPLQYIPKLWKFINTCLPDKLSNLVILGSSFILNIKPSISFCAISSFLRSSAS